MITLLIGLSKLTEFPPEHKNIFLYKLNRYYPVNYGRKRTSFGQFRPKFSKIVLLLKLVKDSYTFQDFCLD